MPRQETDHARAENVIGDGLGALVLPVSLDAALAWAAGEITDDDLAAAGTMEPGALFAVDLKNRSAWRLGLMQARFWWALGARAMVTATRVPVMRRHYTRAGMRQTAFDGDDRCRFYVGAEVLGAYLGTMDQKAAASAGVTNSR